MTAAGYEFESSPSVIDGRFPGLVVEYRRQRQMGTAMTVQWTQRFLGEAARSVTSPMEPVASRNRPVNDTRSLRGFS